MFVFEYVTTEFSDVSDMSYDALFRKCAFHTERCTGSKGIANALAKSIKQHEVT